LQWRFLFVHENCTEIHFFSLDPIHIRRNKFDSLHWRQQQLNNANIQLVCQLLQNFQRRVDSSPLDFADHGNQGRIINTAGDSLMAEFAGPVNLTVAA